MKVLFILNDAPYGSEKTYNGLRLAMALQKDHPGTEVRIFLMRMRSLQSSRHKTRHKATTVSSAC